MAGWFAGRIVNSRLKPPTSALGRGRDVVVWWVANMVLRCGSPWFQAMIEGSIKYGLRAAAEDAKPDLMIDRPPLEKAQAFRPTRPGRTDP